MDTPLVSAGLRGPCEHGPERYRTVSDFVIYRDINPDFGPPYEIARQTIDCDECGWVVEVRDIERDLRYTGASSPSG